MGWGRGEAKLEILAWQKFMCYGIVSFQRKTLCFTTWHNQLLFNWHSESSPTTDAPLSTSDASPNNPPVDSWEDEADKEHAEGTTLFELN
jgi:hypothetical protein